MKTLLVLVCKHCGIQRDENYCWSCGPTTEDLMSNEEKQKVAQELKDALASSYAVDPVTTREPKVWALFERMQGEIAREIRNMLGEPPYDQKLFDEAQRTRRVESLKIVAADPRDEVSRHEEWRRQHEAAGWVLAPEFNPALKQHTNLVPFSELPETTKSKVRIFDICAKYAQAVAADNLDFQGTEYRSEGL